MPYTTEHEATISKYIDHERTRLNTHGKTLLEYMGFRPDQLEEELRELRSLEVKNREHRVKEQNK